MTSARPAPTLAPGVLVVGFTLAYAAAVAAGRATHVDSGLALAWPAAGVGIAGFLLLRGRWMLGAVAGVCLVTGVLNQTSGLDPLGSWIFGLVNVSNALVAVAVLWRSAGPWPRPITRAGDVAALLAASIAGAAVSAVGGGLVAWWRFDAPLWDGMLLIGFRNALSGFVVAAAVLALPALGAARRRHAHATRNLVTLVVLALVVSAVLMDAPWPITYALFGPLVLVALRAGPEVTAVVVAAQGVIVVVATNAGVGPFQGIASADVRILVAQGLIVTLALVGYAVALTERERARALEVSRHDRDRLRNHMEAALVAAAHVELPEGARPRTVEVNAALLGLTGSSRDRLAGSDPTTWFDPADSAVLTSGLRLLMSGRGTAGWRAQLRMGEEYGAGWVDAALSLVAHDTADGQLSGVVELNLQMIDITAQKRAEQKLAFAATHDDLTGLANRALWSDQVDRALARARRAGGLATALYVDVDRFKAINDTYGHAVGDEVLRQMADRLRLAVGAQDAVARLGGDEFAVLSAVDGEREGVVLAERIQAAMEQPVTVGERTIDVAVSTGVAFAGRDHGGRDDDRLLLRRADTALYAAKDRGRARFEIYSPDLHRDVDHAERLLRQLEAGHRAGELGLHYQPIVDAISGGVVALEGLVRWQHPEHGLLPPAEFLEVLESSDLIHQVGVHLLRGACHDAAALAAAGTPLPVHVNVSARELARPGFVRGVRSALDDTGLEPEHLVLEITENRLITVDGSLLRDLRQLRDMGVQLAVDDFGTGYSALTHLVDLPIGIVKLDRSFVADVASNRSAASVCSGVRAMAEGLGIRAVAEGVETDDQRRILGELGYDQLQGYLFGRPARLQDLGLDVAS